jgi:hypothetical protein
LSGQALIVALEVEAALVRGGGEGKNSRHTWSK